MNTGSSLSKGNRSFTAVERVAAVGTDPNHVCRELAGENDQYSEVNYVQGLYAPNKFETYKPYRSSEPSKMRGGCYIGGKGHFWKFCPGKRCAICGEKGYPMRNCKKSQESSKRDQIMVSNEFQFRGATSAILSIQHSGNPINAI